MLIRARVHPFPSRTRKLSSLLLTILGWRRPGKIGSANTKPTTFVVGFAFVGAFRRGNKPPVLLGEER